MENFRYVTLESGYLADKYNLNKDVTINAVYKTFDDSGRIKAFKCDWREGQPGRPHFFWDSDVAKWMEGAAYLLAKNDMPELEAKVDSIVADIAEHQGSDGYFNIYFTVIDPSKRFSNRDCHELYCAGHLMEAACAYYQATGKDLFLKCMTKYADYIYKVFVEDKSAPYFTPGHEEIELALVKLYHTTGNEKYLRLSEHFINLRGVNQEQNILNHPKYAQNHLPVRQQHEAFGHSVRATYLYSGMADIAYETKDKDLEQACLDLFEDITNRKMYITGGIGSTYYGEAFTVPYDLPNAHAYAETCASVGLIFFAHRMNKLGRNAKYADLIEKELYNGALSGLSASGDRFFYENPLEINLAARKRITATNDGERFPITQRPEIFGCSCCPPNLNRLLASVGEYVYDYEDGVAYINQYVTGSFVKDGAEVSVKTEYPCNGRITFTSNVPTAIRIPGWCENAVLPEGYTDLGNGYVKYPAGTYTIELEMKPVLVQTAVEVTDNIGKAAFMYGPVVYCAEGVDNGDLSTLAYDAAKISEAVKDDTKPVPFFTAKGWRISNPASSKGLYYPVATSAVPCDIRLIPYSLFANRGETDMKIFFNYR